MCLLYYVGDVQHCKETFTFVLLMKINAYNLQNHIHSTYDSNFYLIGSSKMRMYKMKNIIFEEIRYL